MGSSATDPDELTIYEELDEYPGSLDISIDDDLLIYETPTELTLKDSSNDELEIYPIYDGKCILDLGFSLNLPQWDATICGDSSRGKITLRDNKALISVLWIRNPGLEPRALLEDLIHKGYHSISSLIEPSSMVVGDQPAITTEVLFGKGYPLTRKRFVAWISWRSDRFFLASLRSTIDSNYVIDRAFDSMIKSFADFTATKSFNSRPSVMDCWAVSLRDFLCSFGYVSFQNVITRGLQIRIKNMLNGYINDQKEPDEEILLSPDKELVKRAALVWRALDGSGYHVKLMQREGNIWPIVCDPNGMWQAISLRPTDPRKMIGVLVDGRNISDKWYSGICYDSYIPLALDNNIDVNSIEIDMKKLCEPSEVMRFIPPNNRNMQWIQGLKELLQGYVYKHKYYQKKGFSCANTSQILWAFLRDMSYESRLMASFDNHPMPRHMWVIARPTYTDEFVAIEATLSNPYGRLLSLGDVVFDEKYYFGNMYKSSQQFSFFYPNQGMYLNHSGWLEQIVDNSSLS